MGGRVAILDARGAALADTDPGRPISGAGPRSEVRDGEAIVVLRVRTRAGRRTIVLRKSLRDTAAAATVVRAALPVAAVAGLAAALALAVALSFGLLRRLEQLRRGARRLADEGIERPLDLRAGRDEVGEVAIALERMRARLHAEEQGRQAFLDTASHELRTPLASLGGTVELLRRGARPRRARPGVRTAPRAGRAASGRPAERARLRPARAAPGRRRGAARRRAGRPRRAGRDDRRRGRGARTRRRHRAGRRGARAGLGPGRSARGRAHPARAARQRAALRRRPRDDRGRRPARLRARQRARHPRRRARAHLRPLRARVRRRRDRRASASACRWPAAWPAAWAATCAPRRPQRGARFTVTLPACPAPLPVGAAARGYDGSDL